MNNKPEISIIIPVHNGGNKFKKCMDSIAVSFTQPDELIIVADGESDSSWKYAEKFNAKIIKVETAGGPASARNIGARQALKDIIFFIDADVSIQKNTIKKIKDAFTKDSNLTAIIGSYDESPLEQNFLSQYKNLMHHYTHQNANSDAFTFWTGCGAIRRDVFLKIGGFNEKFRRPSIEDIELGYRLIKAGHKILLLKNLQVKHLKRWDAVSLLRADFFYRALPWTKLILKEAGFADDLNINVSNRISVALIFLLLFTLIASFFIPFLLVLSIFAGIILFLLNLDTYRFFKKKKGIKFTLMVIPWHWLYFFYSGIAFILGALSRKS